MSNSRVLVRISLTAVVTSLVLGLVFPGFLWAQAALENPQPGSFQSGIGVISGWVCTANRVEITIDGGAPLPAAYGTTRADTRTACSDDGNNGFGLLFNWNLLTDGVHTLRALRDGVEFARAAFTVATLGLGPFPTDLRGAYRLPDFPQAGRTSRIQWQESQQNFVITNADGMSSGSGSTSPGAALENPPPASFQSGIGLISGWVCTANRVEVTIDGGAPLPAAYGTTRADTRTACSDDGNNGFGLLFNWNLLTDGVHTLRALRDGVEFARATFTVATLGLGQFPTGLSGAYSLPNFPQTGTSTFLRWQESQQNFVLTGLLPPAVSGDLCTTQQGPVVDQAGAQGFGSWTNPCGLLGNTGIFSLSIPAAVQQVAEAQKMQAVAQPFFACGTDLSIVQGNQEFRSTDFRLLDMQGNPVCRTLLPGSTLDTFVSVNAGSALNFNSPFTVNYTNRQVVRFPPQPVLTINPAALDFGAVLCRGGGGGGNGINVEEASKTTTTVCDSITSRLTVTNNSAGTLTGNGVIGIPNAGFSLASPGTFSFSLEAGQSQTVFLVFTPPQPGTFTNTLIVTYNGGQQTVPLSGVGFLQ